MLPSMATLSHGVVTRRVLRVVLAHPADDPVVRLEGPRSVRKSALLRQISAAIGGRILDLDNPGTREAVAADPATFGTGEPVYVNEHQKAPIVLEAIQVEPNRGSRAGRFVLTGSAPHEALPDTARPLSGRLSRLTVSPVSHGELAGAREMLLADALSESSDLVRRTPTSAPPGLVSLLGVFEVLMALSAGSRTMLVIGLVGGLALIAAPWLAARAQRWGLPLLLLATVPFAVVTRWSLVTPVLAVVALAPGVSHIRKRR